MNRLLRYTRIIVSLVIFVVLTAGLSCSCFVIPGVCDWLERIQIGSAVRALSLFSFVVWLMITLVFGRIYCSSVCPMGTLQDISARSIRLGRRARRYPYHYSRPSVTVRYVMLALMVGCMVGGVAVVVSVLDPYLAYKRICDSFLAQLMNPAANLLYNIGLTERQAVVVMSTTITGSIIATFLFVAVVMVSARKGRVLCNTLCPIGTTLGFVSRYAIFQIDIDTDKCIQCRRCEEVCKGECIDLTDHVVDGSRCVDCFDCINVCPNDAIHYTARRKQLSEPMMQRITGIARRQGTAVESRGTSEASRTQNSDNSGSHRHSDNK